METLTDREAFHFEEEYFSDGEGRCLNWTLRREKAKAQVNLLTIELLKQYRKQLSKVTVSPPGPLESHLLLSLPPDVLFEILCYLHPLDLYHLGRVSPQIRHMLEDTHFELIWRNAFDQSPTIPAPLPGFLRTMDWVRFLFDPLLCQTCDSYPAYPDVMFRVRLCAGCRAERFMSAQEVVDKYGMTTYNWAEVVTRACFVSVDPYKRFRYHIDGTALEFNRAEIDEVLPNALALEEAIGLSLTPGRDHETRQAFRDFWDYRIASVKERMLNASGVASWAKEIHYEAKDRGDSDTNKCSSNLKSKLKTFGYDAKDVDYADFYQLYETLCSIVRPRGLRRLSKRRVRSLMGMLKPLLDEAHEGRIRSEKAIALRRRLAPLHQRYKEYSIANHKPSAWPYLPPVYAITSLPEVEPLIEAEGDEDIDVARLNGLLDKIFPSFVNNWLRDKRLELFQQLPSSPKKATTTSDPDQVADVFGLGAENPAERQQTDDFASLDLATAVFTCLGSVKKDLRRGRCLIGYAQAMPHYKCPALKTSWGRRLHFNQAGYDAATFLVRLIGLDPASTTWSAMDTACLNHHRFVCGTCSFEEAHGRMGLNVYNWQGAVRHFIEENHQSPDGHTSPNWALLDQENLAWVRDREGSDPQLEECAWSCGHCSDYFDPHNYGEFQDIMDHLEHSHPDILGRVVGVDIIDMPYYHEAFQESVFMPNER